MKVQKLLLFFVSFSLLSCQTIWIKSKTYKKSPATLQLGSIGIPIKSLGIKGFCTTAFPQFKEGIKVELQFQEFNILTYKTYLKSCSIQGNQPTFSFVDSINPKPLYIGLKLIDELSLLDQIQKPENVSVIKYLQQNPKAKLISTLFLYPGVDEIEALQKADEVFLIQTSYKTYQLALYQNGKFTQYVSLSKSVAFAYELSGFRWINDNHGNWKLGGLLHKNETCPINQYSSYQEAIASEKSLKW